MTLLEIRVFADVIVKDLKIKSSWIGLKFNDWHPFEKKGNTQTERHREEGM